MTGSLVEICQGTLDGVGNLKRITRRSPSADGLSDRFLDVNHANRRLHEGTIHEGSGNARRESGLDFFDFADVVVPVLPADKRSGVDGREGAILWNVTTP